MYSNIGGGAHGQLGLVLTDEQYALILNMPFVYLTHLVPLIILDGMTTHMNSNMRIAKTKEVCLFYEVTGVEQSIYQHIISTIEEAYLMDIHNWTKN